MKSFKFLPVLIILFVLFSDTMFNSGQTKSYSKANEFGLFTNSYLSLHDTLTEITSRSFFTSINNKDSLIKNSGIAEFLSNDFIGKPYFVFTNYGQASPSYVIFEDDNINYTVLDFNGNGNIYKGQKEIRTERKIVTGRINKTLFSSFTETKVNPEIVVRLSQIFSWQIDFHKNKLGDYYKVVYDEKFIGKKSLGVDKILAVQYNHKGKDYYAFSFEQNGVERFYDERGRSLKKTFMKAPLDYTRISSPYSLERFHPVLKVNKPHFGTDYAAPEGTPIRAAGDGIVTIAGYHRGNGKYIKIQHNNVYTTQYLHMSGFAKGIKRGTRIKQGDIIGYVGSTGLATGPHLCYRFWKHGVQIDPYQEDFPSAFPPVSTVNRVEFEKFKTSLAEDLNSVKIPWLNRIFSLAI